MRVITQDDTEPTFILVHGAWGGAWSVSRLEDRLVSRGKRVLSVTLSGLGERSHLASFDIRLNTHVADVANEVLWRDIRNVILVGVSYGGMVITGAAEELGPRVVAIAYVDAFLPIDGQSFADITGWAPTGVLTPPPEMPLEGFLTEADHAWVLSKVTPQPTATFTDRLHHTGAVHRVPHKLYVKATGWSGPFDQLVANLRQDPSWNIAEVPCGHDIPNLRPEELATCLEELQDLAQLTSALPTAT